MSRESFTSAVVLAFAGVLFLGIAFFGPETQPIVGYTWLATVVLLAGVLAYSVYKRVEEVTRRLRNPFG